MRMESGNTRISGMDILGLSQSDDDPHLALFDRLNAFTRGRQLRRYQRDIWLSGRFTIELPGNREPRQADGTLLAEVKAYAWRFPGAEGPLWLTSTGPNLGYAISAIINPKDKTIILAPEGDVEITALFARAITGIPSIAGNPSEAILLAGHENFAHFIWNELPALLELESLDAKISAVHTTFEPILPLGRLTRLPSSLTPRPSILARGWMDPVLVQPGVLFSAGSTLVTRQTQNRALERCRSETGPIPLKTAGTKRIWISLRRLYRTASNELDVFTRLLEMLGRAERKFEILLDGYSLPQDLSFSGRYNIPWQEAQNRLVTDFAAMLIAAAGHTKLTIHDLTRCNLATALAWAATADAYICHHGTQQHKIGWLNAVPGLVHVNRHILATHPGRWTAQQAEGAIPPDYMPEEMIGYTRSDNARQDMPYFQDYCFTDPQKAADIMFAFLLEKCCRT